MLQHARWTRPNATAGLAQRLAATPRLITGQSARALIYSPKGRFPSRRGSEVFKALSTSAGP